MTDLYLKPKIDTDYSNDLNLDIKIEPIDLQEESIFIENGLTYDTLKQEDQGFRICIEAPSHPNHCDDMSNFKNISKIDIKKIDEVTMMNSQDLKTECDISIEEENIEEVNFVGKECPSITSEKILEVLESIGCPSSSEHFLCSTTSKVEDNENYQTKELKSKVKKKPRKKYVCETCQYTTIYRSSFMRHKTTHSDVKNFKCPECEYRCSYQSKLNAHIQIHSNAEHLKCSQCDYECNLKSYMKKHLLTHSNTKLFKCNVCGYECNRKYLFKSHLLSHSSNKLFKCTECSYETHANYLLKSHLVAHSNTKTFKCPECDFHGKRKGDLTCHLLTHSNDKIFQCSECSYRTKYKKHLKRHILQSQKHKNCFNSND